MPKTHEEIWTEIAEAFYTPDEEATLRQRWIAWGGLCGAFLMVTGVDIGEAPKSTFGADYENEPFWLPPRHWSTWTPECDLLRGDIATLFSLMTEKEFNELLGKE